MFQQGPWGFIYFISPWRHPTRREKFSINKMAFALWKNHRTKPGNCSLPWLAQSIWNQTPSDDLSAVIGKGTFPLEQPKHFIKAWLVSFLRVLMLSVLGMFINQGNLSTEHFVGKSTLTLPFLLPKYTTSPASKSSNHVRVYIHMYIYICTYK